MKIITKEEIKRLLNQDEYKHAMYLDPQKYISRMTISGGENSDTYNVVARIANGEEAYACSIKIDLKGKVTSYSCKLAHPLYWVGMILLFIESVDIYELPFTFDPNSTELSDLTKPLEAKDNPAYKESLSLISFYYDQAKRKSNIPVYFSDNYLKVEVEYHNKLDLQFKFIHEGKPYKIKNIQDFLNAISKHETVRFSNNVSLVMSETIFDDDSKEILELMRFSLYNDENALLDKFFDTMWSLPSKYSNKAYNLLDDKVKIHIDDRDESYLLTIDEGQFTNVIFSKMAMYSFEVDYVICHPLNEEAATLLSRMTNNHFQLLVPKAYTYDFYKYVLKDTEAFVEVDDDIWSDYHTENQINLYCDINDDHIMIAQLEYIYDEDIAYGFENHPYVSKEADIIESYLRDFMDTIEDHIIYFRDDDELVYHFVLEGLPYLSNYCNVYATDTLKSMGNSQSIGLKVSLNAHNHLLDINIDSVHLDKEELYDVLNAYSKKRKYYKLKNGKLLSLDSGELKELNSLREYLSLTKQDFTNASIQLPEYRLFNVEELSNNAKFIEFNRQENYKQCLENFHTKKEFALPDNFKPILRDYQKEGFNWLSTMDEYGFGGILADDMGLGKTLQMLSYLESKKGKGASIVVTPASLVYNWYDELAKFGSKLKVLMVSGDKETRLAQIETLKDYDLVLTSYDYLRRDISSYQEIQFECCVLDEAQYIKNPSTKSASSVKRINAHHRFALTGTPIENSLTEMWSIFDFLMPYYLYTHNYFVKNFEQPIVSNQNEEKTEQLKSMISPFILRRNKREVLKELPDKIEQDLYYTMSEEEEKFYISHLVTINKKLQKEMGIKNVGKTEVLAMLTRLRQICQDPRIIDPNNFVVPSTKVKNAMELIRNLKENNRKVLLFSSFTSVLDLLEEECNKEHISYMRLDGSVNKQKRKQMVDTFQTDDTTLFLISLKAGGTGLNLTSASAVIHFDPWWNMSVKSQATDRTHRIGQKETVHVYSLYMKNSIEEKIHNLQKEKMSLADSFVEGNEGKVTTMTMEDLASLFEMNG